MKLIAFVFFLGITLFPVDVFSQNQVNQLDDNGKPHGTWKKYYEGTEQLRYEGKFHHGKEIGEFKFYCEDCKNQPEAIKKFNRNDDIAEVKFFTKKGNVVSEGQMKGKDRIGEWITYHKNSKIPMIRETYSNGKLHGKQTIYYSNGKITEEVNYNNGLKDGANIYYSTKGVAIKKFQYKDGNLHGPATYYDGHGNLIIEGAYKDNKKHGLWKYYKNGKVTVEETFPKKNRE
ncbi:toxin-antitoxin system YwqK family antitoxin [Aequorivita viscosa]|uniref:MORN repeat variant n=1 Tax=Aequorivita viscosa TaxID=797419 RepID=A0A1M6IGI7_9FLAO|nr:hypothetical protein [Aequorivita viscosa]SDW57513.1 MORN repeat variant [Aequorivita viscosa]SHJ33547.1 MORN repeat variant [Aequorivita viscosa]